MTEINSTSMAAMEHSNARPEKRNINDGRKSMTQEIEHVRANNPDAGRKKNTQRINVKKTSRW